METDAQAYTGVPPDRPRAASARPGRGDEAARVVANYRAALAQAARDGRLDDACGNTIAADMLGLAAASGLAAALVEYERALHAQRRQARAWSGGKSDQSAKVRVLESLADEAAERLQADLACLPH